MGVSLAHGRIHEVTGVSVDGFAASVISLTDGPLIWVGRKRDVYSVCPLAAQSYFDPARLVMTECTTRKEILWAAEQALRSKGTDCVVMQLCQGPNLNESRRLQLAAEAGQTLGLILIEKTAHSSACETRWRCTPVASEHVANDTMWTWELIKNKSGIPGVWHVRWKEDAHATGHVVVVPSAAT
jgi:protein ImuA